MTDGPYTIRLPEDLADGNYNWTIGLFSPTGGRIPLEGEDDGFGRIKLGTLSVRNRGAEIRFSPARESGGEREQLYSQHLNIAGKAVDFGAVRTNGSLWAKRDGKVWTLIAYPRDAKFIMELDARRFGSPRMIASVGGSGNALKPIRVNPNRWRLPMNGAKAYRWKTD